MGRSIGRHGLVFLIYYIDILHYDILSYSVHRKGGPSDRVVVYLLEEGWGLYEREGSLPLGGRPLCVEGGKPPPSHKREATLALNEYCRRYNKR